MDSFGILTHMAEWHCSCLRAGQFSYTFGHVQLKHPGPSCPKCHKVYQSTSVVSVWEYQNTLTFNFSFLKEKHMNTFRDYCFKAYIKIKKRNEALIL